MSSGPSGLFITAKTAEGTLIETLLADIGYFAFNFWRFTISEITSIWSESIMSTGSHERRPLTTEDSAWKNSGVQNPWTPGWNSQKTSKWAVSLSSKSPEKLLSSSIPPFHSPEFGKGGKSLESVLSYNSESAALPTSWMTRTWRAKYCLIEQWNHGQEVRACSVEYQEAFDILLIC